LFFSINYTGTLLFCVSSDCRQGPRDGSIRHDDTNQRITSNVSYIIRFQVTSKVTLL